MDSSKDYEESNPSENSDVVNSSTTKKVKSSQKKNHKKVIYFQIFPWVFSAKKN